MELDGCREEGGRHLLVQGQGCVHQLLDVLLDLGGEPSSRHVALEDAEVDGPQGVQLREADGKHAEVSLKTCVDGEAAGSRVHGGHVLDILDLLEDQLLPVVPVTVVQVLGGGGEEGGEGRKGGRVKNQR